MENRIKELQLALFADRTSCHDWWPNQFHLIHSSLAYTLIGATRRRPTSVHQMIQATMASPVALAPIVHQLCGLIALSVLLSRWSGISQTSGFRL